MVRPITSWGAALSLLEIFIFRFIATTDFASFPPLILRIAVPTVQRPVGNGMFLCFLEVLRHAEAPLFQTTVP